MLWILLEMSKYKTVMFKWGYMAGLFKNGQISVAEAGSSFVKKHWLYISVQSFKNSSWNMQFIKIYNFIQKILFLDSKDNYINVL